VARQRDYRLRQQSSHMAVEVWRLWGFVAALCFWAWPSANDTGNQKYWLEHWERHPPTFQPWRTLPMCSGVSRSDDNTPPWRFPLVPRLLEP
jgi:hypothetical protein